MVFIKLARRPRPNDADPLVLTQATLFVLERQLDRHRSFPRSAAESGLLVTGPHSPKERQPSYPVPTEVP